jgi:phosphoribosyl-ATP pyrophosphohydrolase/phosphoribosyl-AMP cyclohydrolase
MTVKQIDFLVTLQDLIEKRKSELPENSYTTSLFKKGINKIAQKVGEEAVELVIEAKDDNRDLFLNESADLVYHMLVLLAAKGCRIEDVVEVLERRHL